MTIRRRKSWGNLKGSWLKRRQPDALEIDKAGVPEELIPDNESAVEIDKAGVPEELIPDNESSREVEVSTKDKVEVVTDLSSSSDSSSSSSESSGSIYSELLQDVFGNRSTLETIDFQNLEVTLDFEYENEINKECQPEEVHAQDVQETKTQQNQEREENNKEEEYSGHPCSRSILIDRNQRSALRFLLQNIHESSPFEERFYFKWSVWNYKSSRLTISSIIETHLDLQRYLKYFKTHEEKVYLFRFGLYPIRKTFRGHTIEFRITEPYEYGFFRSVSEIILCNRIYSTPENVTIGVCGISIAKHLNHMVSTIWIHPSNISSESLHEQVVNLVDVLRSNMTSEYNRFLHKFVLTSSLASELIMIE